MKNTIFALIYSSIFITTTGFQLTSIHKQTQFTFTCISKPHTAVSIVPRIKSRTYSSGDNFLQLAGHNVRQLPEKTRTSSSHYKCGFVKFIKRMLALSASILFLNIMTHRPNVAAATVIAPSPLSSDPAVLANSMDALSTLSTANEGASSSLLVTAMSIIRAKRQVIVTSTVVVSAIRSILKCAEVGYAKFVEFYFGYYGMTGRDQSKYSQKGFEKQTKGWYINLYLRLKERVLKLMHKEKDDEQTLHRHSASASSIHCDDKVEEMELKTLDDKAQQYEKAIQESKDINAAPVRVRFVGSKPPLKSEKRTCSGSGSRVVQMKLSHYIW